MEHMPKSPFPIDDVFPSDRVAESLGYKRVDSSDGKTEWRQVGQEAANDDATIAPPSHDRPTLRLETLRSPQGEEAPQDTSTTIRVEDRTMTDRAPAQGENETAA